MLRHRLILICSALALVACGETVTETPEAADGPDLKATGPACGTFADVGRDHWAYGAIEAGTELGLWSGCATSPARFCPDDIASRAAAAVILARAAGVDPVQPSGQVFSDVPSTHWAAGRIEALYEKGYIAGCGGGQFCPTEGLTRAQLAALISSIAGFEPTANPPARFSDVSPDFWAAGWIETARANGIMVGCAADKFCPDRQATRAELAAVVTSAFNIERAPLCEPDPDDNPLPVGSLAGLRVAIDVGHGYTSSGAFDPGAVNRADPNLTEYLANRETAIQVTEMLEAAGARVSVFDYARGTPERLTLRQKGARASGHDLFISIHHNAFNGRVQGTETLVDNAVATSADRGLASAIQRQLIEHVWDGDSRYDRGVKSQALGVLRGASGRTGAKVLVECFFIDVAGVDQPELTRRSSRAIALGIAAFWNG